MGESGKDRGLTIVGRETWLKFSIAQAKGQLPIPTSRGCGTWKSGWRVNKGRLTPIRRGPWIADEGRLASIHRPLMGLGGSESAASMFHQPVKRRPAADMKLQHRPVRRLESSPCPLIKIHCRLAIPAIRLTAEEGRSLDPVMSIEQRRVVDFIGTDKADGHVSLTISDHLPWLNDNEHLLILQNKINDYLAFLESGEIYDSYPKAHGREIEIRLICKYPPAGDGVRFLELASKTVRKAGFRFSVHTS